MRQRPQLAGAICLVAMLGTLAVRSAFASPLGVYALRSDPASSTAGQPVSGGITGVALIPPQAAAGLSAYQATLVARAVLAYFGGVQVSEALSGLSQPYDPLDFSDLDPSS
jgi:hypothetical protein